MKKLQAALNTSIAARRELATLVQQTSVVMARCQAQLYERLAIIQRVALEDAQRTTGTIEQEMARFGSALPSDRQINANSEIAYDN